MRKHGFTLIEISMVLAISAILLTLTMMNLTRVQINTYVDTSVETLLSDIKLQQTKAMNGRLDQSGQATEHGIHFETNSYTLFEGNTYDALDPTNFTVSLQGVTAFTSITFPANQIVFQKGSGEIANFSNGNNTITVQEPDSGIQTQITINELGVFTNIQ